MNVRKRFESIIANRILICDGAMGTLLQERGLPTGQPPEVMLLTSPDEVQAVHGQYRDAGADVLTTNTFGANRLKLKQYGLEDQIERINSLAVRVARTAAGDEAFVAACIGPTGELLRPMGALTMPELVDIYREQIRYLMRAGADFAILETMSDIGELQAAARACHALEFPFVASMTFNETGRSLTGSTPEITAVTLEPFEPLAVGVNCGPGPDDMTRQVTDYVAATHLPILAQPNAGLPELSGGKTVFKLSPEAFAKQSAALAGAGAAIIGGCCGTTPDHIRMLRRAVQGISPLARRVNTCVRFSARSGVAVAGVNHPFCIIGERINPTGRKRLSRQLKEHDFSGVRREALHQAERGAHILDINVGVPDTNETELMLRVIDEIQGMLPGIPLSIDSSDPVTMAAGLRHVVGRPLLNSVNGSDARMDELLPLVAETGANLIALAMDETGMPQTAAERMTVIRRIVARAEQFGIARNRICVDALVFTVASEPRQAAETLAAIRRIRDELGCATVLGVSNVSFGLPGRDVMTSAFLAMAMVSGLNAGIVNPVSDRLIETVRAADVLLQTDTGAARYVAAMESIVPVRTRDTVSNSHLSKPVSADDNDSVLKTMKEGDRERLVSVVDGLLAAGKPPDRILSDDLAPAIQAIGKMYGCGTIFLPQLILAGEAMRCAVTHIRPMLSQSAGKTLHGTPLVIGTVEGDIHDIGKNIVSIVLENHGFEVHDLGKNIASDSFLDAVSKTGAGLVALSALMTTTMPAMEKTVRTLRDRYPDVRIMVGGAVITQEYADRIGADGYAGEAVGAGTLALKLAGLT